MRCHTNFRSHSLDILKFILFTFYLKLYFNHFLYALCLHILFYVGLLAYCFMMQIYTFILKSP
uniref:Uncharacterized protein n=1 Tax=CrAss-like virus sp. ctcfK29 TaxID=2826827 RepID=A0A8S5MJY1_9CAUD|nr:MAG TPA: hypothetical protein [CrAss-like virus sp. ctcfK29]